MRKHLELRSLEVLPRVVGVLDHVVGGVGLHQPDDPLDTAERGGGATSLQDHPSLGHKQRALRQDVGIDLGVGHEGNYFALGNHQHFLQSNPGHQQITEAERKSIFFFQKTLEYFSDHSQCRIYFSL